MFSSLSECDDPLTVVSFNGLAPVLGLFFGIFDVIREGIWFAVTTSTSGQRERSEQH